MLLRKYSKEIKWIKEWMRIFIGCFFRILKTELFLNWFFPFLNSLMIFISFTVFFLYISLMRSLTFFYFLPSHYYGIHCFPWKLEKFFFYTSHLLHYFSIFFSVSSSKSIILKFFPHLFLLWTTENNHVWSHYMSKYVYSR